MPSSVNDQDSSDEDLNATKDDFESVVARQCQETLRNFNSTPAKNNLNNTLLYSKSDDESHAAKRVEDNKSNKKRKKKRTNKYSSGSDTDEKTSENPFMNKVKQLSKNKLHLESFIGDNREETNMSRTANEQLLNSDSESDKENDSSSIHNKLNSPPLNKSSKNKSLLTSDQSPTDLVNDISSNYENDKNKNKIDSDSDDDSSAISTKGDPCPKPTIPSSKFKRSRVLSESDDSEIETNKTDKLLPNYPETAADSAQKRARTSLDSDDEVEENRSVNTAFKRRHIIESDED